MIVEAVGTAVGTGKANDSKLIQAVMNQVILDIQAECERIWATSMPLEEKNARIDAIRNPTAMREAMLAARANVKAQQRGTDEPTLPEGT